MIDTCRIVEYFLVIPCMVPVDTGAQMGEIYVDTDVQIGEVSMDTKLVQAVRETIYVEAQMGWIQSLK